MSINTTIESTPTIALSDSSATGTISKEKPSLSQKITPIIQGCLLFAIFCTALYLYMRPLEIHTSSEVRLSPAGNTVEHQTKQEPTPAVDHRAQIKEALAESTPPLLAAMHQADQEALEALQQNIHHDFTAYRKNIPAFVDHMTGSGAELGLLGMYFGEGYKGTATAVQMTFNEEVVSPAALRRNIQSHIIAFISQLEENRAKFMVDLSDQMKQTLQMEALELPEAWQKALDDQLQQMSANGLQLSANIAVKLAAAPIVSTSGAYLAQMIAVRILETLPQRAGWSLLKTFTKSNLATFAAFLGIDYLLSEKGKNDISNAVTSQLNKAEESIQRVMQQRADSVIQQDEQAWNEQVNNIAQNLEVQS